MRIALVGPGIIEIPPKDGVLLSLLSGIMQQNLESWGILEQL